MYTSICMVVQHLHTAQIGQIQPPSVRTASITQNSRFVSTLKSSSYEEDVAFCVHFT